MMLCDLKRTRMILVQFSFFLFWSYKAGDVNKKRMLVKCTKQNRVCHFSTKIGCAETKFLHAGYKEKERTAAAGALY
jgi:hypothetical protein